MGRVLYRIIAGLIAVAVIGAILYYVNRGLFADPEPEPARERFIYPESRSVVVFSEDVFSRAVSLSEWAEWKGNTLRPKEGMEDRFREAVNPRGLASLLADGNQNIVWDEDGPSLTLREKDGFCPIPTWVLWMFREELQEL